VTSTIQRDTTCRG